MLIVCNSRHAQPVVVQMVEEHASQQAAAAASRRGARSLSAKAIEGLEGVESRFQVGTRQGP